MSKVQGVSQHFSRPGRRFLRFSGLSGLSGHRLSADDITALDEPHSSRDAVKGPASQNGKVEGATNICLQPFSHSTAASGSQPFNMVNIYLRGHLGVKNSAPSWVQGIKINEVPFLGGGSIKRKSCYESGVADR